MRVNFYYMTTMKTLNTLLFVVLTLTSFDLLSQSTGDLNGQEGSRVITTAVPFLSFAPDSRASGMGDVGVATSPDANSTHWNNGKLAFIDQDFGFSMSYTPWLQKLVGDMYVAYLSGFYKIDRVQTIGASFRYFDLGSIQLTNDTGGLLNIESPNEFAVDVTYSRKLSEKMGIGVTARYINSNIVGITSGAGKAGQSFAIDLGYYYSTPIVISGRDSNLSFGGAITNVGQKVTYGSTEEADFIPINLRVGTALKVGLDAYNSLTFAIDFNKLLVPTPPIYAVDDFGVILTETDNNGNEIPVLKSGKDPDRNLLSGMFGSFSDHNDDPSEELREIMIASGVEYWYQDLFAARLGYFYEHMEKGGRQYFTVGAGFRYQKFGVDFSYLIPRENDNPLAETLRFSLLFNLEKSESADGISN